MSTRRSAAHVRAHITFISRRTHSDAQVLTDALHGRSWPGGGDRIDPGGVAVLRRALPLMHASYPDLCECAQGRCLVCN